MLYNITQTETYTLPAYLGMVRKPNTKLLLVKCNSYIISIRNLVLKTIE